MQERNWQEIAKQLALQIVMKPRAEFTAHVVWLRDRAAHYRADPRPAIQPLARRYAETADFLTEERKKTEEFWRRNGECDGCGRTLGRDHKPGCHYLAEADYEETSDRR